MLNIEKNTKNIHIKAEQKKIQNLFSAFKSEVNKNAKIYKQSSNCISFLFHMEHVVFKVSNYKQSLNK